MIVLTLMWACVDDAEVVEPYRMGDCVVPETTGDATAWLAWAEEQRAEFEATGMCPTEAPAEAVLADGCRYPTDPFVFSAEATNRLSVRYSMDGAFLATRLKLESWSWREDRGCDGGGAPLEEGDYLLQMEWTDLGQQAPPAFTITTDGYYSQQNLIDVYTIHDGSYDSAVNSAVLGWVCLESLAPLAGEVDGPTNARGSAYFHVENWGLGKSGPPIDLFLPIDHDDCADAENADGPICSENDCVYPADCDGVDNDLDGEIDEFGNGSDGDGVVNCE